MPNNRDVDSPFRKRILLPLWLIRDAVMALNLVVYILVIAAVSYADRSGSSGPLGSNYDEVRREGLVGLVIGIAAVCMVIIAFCLSLDIACIVKRYRHTLSPKFFLVTNIIQTIIWTVLTILTLIGNRNAISIVLAIAIYLTFLGMLIYAVRVYRRSKKEAQLFGDKHGAAPYQQQPAPVGNYQPPQAAHVV